MTYTTPRTWVAGEVPTAAIFNTHLRDNMTGTSAYVTNGTNVDAANTIAVQRCGLVLVIVSAVTTAAVASGATLFTLPVGYRHPAGVYYGDVVNTTTNTVVRLAIASTGVVTIGANIASGETVHGQFLIAL